MTERIIETMKKRLPRIELSRPCSKIGRRMMMAIPMRLMAVPRRTFFLGFSCKNSIEPRMRKTGAAELIIGALMLAVRRRPMKR